MDYTNNHNPKTAKECLDCLAQAFNERGPGKIINGYLSAIEGLFIQTQDVLESDRTDIDKKNILIENLKALKHYKEKLEELAPYVAKISFANASNIFYTYKNNTHHAKYQPQRQREFDILNGFKR